MVEQWDEKGRCDIHGGVDCRDLILTRRFYVPVYSNLSGEVSLGVPHLTARDARAVAELSALSTRPHRRLVAIVPIEFQEGDGLEGG